MKLLSYIACTLPLLFLNYSPTCAQVWQDIVLDGGVINNPAEKFRKVHTYASTNGYVAAFPTFFTGGVAPSGVSSLPQTQLGGTLNIGGYNQEVNLSPSPYVHGAVLLNSNCARWVDVQGRFSSAFYNDFVMKFRLVNSLAVRNNWVAGFPTFHQSNNRSGVVLLNQNCATRRDVSLSELGLQDFRHSIDHRFRAVNTYATKNGFVGGFPTFESSGDRLGVVLIRR